LFLSIVDHQELLGGLFERDPLAGLLGIQIARRQSMLNRIDAIG
jgi:hypothetical protein